MAKEMYDTCLEILNGAKAEIVPFELGHLEPNGSAIHEHGTCRMGADPKRSALTSFCQMHDVKNVFVVDGGAFTTASEKNPTLTILALAWRATDYMADEMRIEDLIEEEDVVITVSHLGYIKRTSAVEFRSQRRGGRGQKNPLAAQQRGHEVGEGLAHAGTRLDDEHAALFDRPGDGHCHVDLALPRPELLGRARQHAALLEHRAHLGLQSERGIRAVIGAEPRGIFAHSETSALRAAVRAPSGGRAGLMRAL